MWKIMIADDEPKIRRGLRQALERIDNEIAVVGEAQDGEEALILARDTEPDILFIDICMPFLDGLELIDRLNALKRNWLVIVVTGHDEFDYAQKAVKLQVFDYVLKPVSQEQLEAVVRKAAEELLSRRSHLRYVGWAQKQLERNLPHLTEEFFRSLVEGRLSVSEIEEQRAFLGVDSGPWNGLMLLHLRERTFPQRDERGRQLDLLTMRNAAREALADLGPLTFFPDSYGNLAVIAGQASGETWIDAAALVSRALGEGLREEVLLVQRQLGEGPAALIEAYEELLTDLALAMGQGAGVQAIRAYVEAHYCRHDLSLEEAAGALRLSAGYLSRLLKQGTGCSFVDYLTRVRIQKAAQLLNDPTVKIFAVAEAVGYRSQHYFSRAFRKVLGLSPVEYRNGLKGVPA